MKIFLTNLSKYNNGELLGQWVELPVYGEDLDDVLLSIGIDENNEEYFITDYEDSPIKIEEFDSIEYLNEIAEKYSELNQHEAEAVEAFLECIGGDFLEALAVIKEGDWYSLQDIQNKYDLGFEIFHEHYTFDNKDDIFTRYFDYKSFGNDLIMGDNWYLYEGKAYQFYY